MTIETKSEPCSSTSQTSVMYPSYYGSSEALNVHWLGFLLTETSGSSSTLQVLLLS